MAKAKTTTGSKLMEKFAAMGFTIEPATAAHIKNVKANMSTEKPEVIFCRDYADKEKKDRVFKSWLQAKKDREKIAAANKAITERKPEKANIYSCKANTLETSIDYTKTDLKQLETLSNKKAKIENTLDTFELLEKSKIENEIAKVKRKAVKRTSKNIQKCSNKRLKEITDNAHETMKHNAELTATAKQTTTLSEFVSMSRQFKKAFRDVVTAEYNENCLDISAKLSALHEKQKALDGKRKQLKTKISACESVISQLEKTDKNKINYPLIDSKLDVIGISLTEYSLTEVQAVKTSINTTLANVNAKIGNILDDIKALTNLNAAYSKIKNGKEIKIDVTTKSLNKNIFFSVVVGYDINKNNSTYAILHIRQLTEKTLEKIGLNECIVDVNYNVFRNSDAGIKLALARQITKRQSYNMIARQGSKTQYNIYHCAMRNDFNDHDTSDIYSTAYTQIENTLSVKNAADIVKAKKVINALNAKIQHLNPDIDGYIVNKYVKTANAVLKDVYKIAFVVADNDYKTNKSFITVLENMYTAISEKSVKALKTSCYNKINTYLTSIRAIREKSDVANIDSVINSESERFYTLFEDNQEVEYSEKSTILRMCYSTMKKCLNKDALKVFELMGKGYSTTQIAEKKKVDRSVISKQTNDIKQAFIKCYTDIKNNENNKELFKNNPIVFAPSVFDDCKTISGKAEKIVNTYNQKTEIERIKNAVGEMSAEKYADMQNAFINFTKNDLTDPQMKIFNKLLDNASIREVASYADVSKKTVENTRNKIIKKLFEVIEKYTKITINKDSLKKVEFSALIELIKTA